MLKRLKFIDTQRKLYLWVSIKFFLLSYLSVAKSTFPFPSNFI